MSRRGGPIRWAIGRGLLGAATLDCLLAVGCGDPAPRAKATLWREADALFHADPRWIGGDGAYSVELGNDRVLWLFGDSFIATTPEHRRAHSKMVRNSVALQTGRDPSSAFMQFYYPQKNADPQSFAPEEGGSWFWPMHGVRLDDILLLFYERLNSPAGDPTGFETNASRAFWVPNPDDDVSEWQLLPASTPPPPLHDITFGEAAVARGDELYLYGTRGDRHAVYLARVSVAEARARNLGNMQFWDGSGYSANPEPVLDFGAPEFSLHYDARLDKWVMVQTEGYGASTLAWRVADAPEGPFTDPGDLLRPPESFEPDAFVYAGKAHPELHGADLVATYVPSSFGDRPSYEDEKRLYYPHFVRVTYR